MTAGPRLIRSLSAIRSVVGSVGPIDWLRRGGNPIPFLALIISSAMLLIPSTAVPDARLAAAYIIFLSSYLVFAIGKFPGLKIDRPGAAIIGAVAMIAFRVVQPSD